MKVFGTDYDGVMINIEPQKAAAFGVLVSRRWGIAQRAAADFWFHGNVSGRRNIFNGVYKGKFGKELADKEYESVEKEFSALLKNEFYPLAALLPGALDLIKFAKANFDHTFISSGVPMEEIKYLTKLNGVADYFDLVLGTNKQFPTKYAHFAEIRKKWSPSKLLFVADGLTDMKISKENGAVPIGLPTNHSKQELLNAGAAVVIPLPEAIAAISRLLDRPDFLERTD